MSDPRVLTYLVAFSLGAVAPFVLPASFMLPVFFGLLAACGLLLLAAHTVNSTPLHTGSLGKVLAILVAIAGPSGIQIRSGRSPFYLDTVFLLILGYIIALCLR